MKTRYKNIHQSLIDKCKKGSSKAQFEIYKLYYKAMYNTSLRIVNNKLEAEDIMQEAFLSAFNKLKTYKEEVSFGAWLKRIVINKSLDYLKKKKVEFIQIEEKILNISDNNNNYDSKNVDLEIGKIKKTIMKLPDGYRIILSLYLLEGYDHSEIAEILKINSSTSRSQLARAKKKLLQHLK